MFGFSSGEIRFGDFDRLPNSVHLNLFGIGLGVDSAGVLSQQAEGVDHDRPHHPADDEGADNETTADQHHTQVQLVDCPACF